MKRRKFAQATAMAVALPFGLTARQLAVSQSQDKEWYELRTYEIKFRGNSNLLITYLKEALKPALVRAGANRFILFREIGNSEPVLLRLWISYPDIESYLAAQNLSGDLEYQRAAATYNALTIDKAIYSRYSSWLLNAFDALPVSLDPIPDASLFELRTYECFSEDALRRKIKMFNTGELDLFYKVKLNPVFFGEMIAGPHRPCLTYVINFKDMAAHDACWSTFREHPEWISMRDKAEYADIMTNIRKTFLELL